MNVHKSCIWARPDSRGACDFEVAGVQTDTSIWWLQAAVRTGSCPCRHGHARAILLGAARAVAGLRAQTHSSSSEHRCELGRPLRTGAVVAARVVVIAFNDDPARWPLVGERNLADDMRQLGRRAFRRRPMPAVGAGEQHVRAHRLRLAAVLVDEAEVRRAVGLEIVRLEVCRASVLQPRRHATDERRRRARAYSCCGESGRGRSVRGSPGRLATRTAQPRSVCQIEANGCGVRAGLRTSEPSMRTIAPLLTMMPTPKLFSKFPSTTLTELIAESRCRPTRFPLK